MNLFRPLFSGNPVIWFARSRNVPRLATVAVVIVTGSTLARTNAITLPLYRVGLDFSVPLVTMAPAVIGILFGSALHSPMGDLEQTASRSMRKVRITFIASLLFLGLCLVCLPAGGDAHLGITAGRNYVGFFGLTLLTGAIIGWGLSWLVPLVSLGITIVYGVDSANNPFVWAWFLMPPSEVTSWLVALAGLSLGAVIAVQREVEPRAQQSA